MSDAAQSLQGRPRLLDEMAIARAVLRLAHELIEKHDAQPVLLVGIRTRGVPLAGARPVQLGAGPFRPHGGGQ